MKFPKTAKRLIDSMNSKGISAQELSNKSGVGKSAISHYINGNNEPRSVNAGKMADVLGVNPMWLMGFDEDIVEKNSADAKLDSVIAKMDDETKNRLLAYARFLLTDEEG